MYVNNISVYTTGHRYTGKYSENVMLKLADSNDSMFLKCPKPPNLGIDFIDRFYDFCFRNIEFILRLMKVLWVGGMGSMIFAKNSQTKTLITSGLVLSGHHQKLKSAFINLSPKKAPRIFNSSVIPSAISKIWVQYYLLDKSEHTMYNCSNR